MTGEKSEVVDILKDVPLNLVEKVLKLKCLVVEGFAYDVIIGELTMEGLDGISDVGNRVSSFVVACDKVQIQIKP